MLLASLLFACMGVCVKLAAATHSAVEITFYRSFISLFIMFGLVRLNGVALATPHWRWQVSRGVVGFAALFAYFYAIIQLPLATAVTLNYTSAIFLAIYLALAGMRMSVGILGALFWGEVLDMSAWLAIGLIILSGVAATHFSRASPVEQD